MDTPIKNAPQVRVPSGYDFSKVAITLDVPMNDQNGNFIGMDSQALNLGEPSDVAGLTPVQLTKIQEVAKVLFKLAGKIN